MVVETFSGSDRHEFQWEEDVHLHTPLTDKEGNPGSNHEVTRVELIKKNKFVSRQSDWDSNTLDGTPVSTRVICNGVARE